MLKYISKKTFFEDLKEGTKVLLELARNSCWNNISENTKFIVSEIVDDNMSFEDKRVKRKKDNIKKPLMSLIQAFSQLNAIYDDLYDVNLYIFRSKKELTIIEIKYYLKSSLQEDFLKIVIDNKPMLHCRVPLPPYVMNKNEKFDVNWELGGFKHRLNMFWSRIKLK